MSHDSRATEQPAMRVVVFNLAGEFKAMHAAERWCAENGFSIGRGQRGSPRGLLRGAWDIAKWRNLSRQERGDLDGTVTGDARSGPVTIRIKAGR